MPGPIHSNPATSPMPHRPAGGRPRSAAGAAQTSADAADAELKAACEDMEALFIHYMLSEMRKTVDKSGLIDGGRSEEIYTSLLDAELAKEMARSNGLGLSGILQEQLRRLGNQPSGADRRR